MALLDRLQAGIAGRTEARKAQALGAVRRAVPAGLRAYAVGDIHGRLDLLEALHEEIRADAAASTAERRLVVYLGDYVDRGPSSRQVIDSLVAQPLEGFETVHLMGNHEFFLQRFLSDPGVGEVWLMNGGEATLRSYGIEPLDAPPGGA